MRIQSGQRVRITGASTMEIEARNRSGSERLLMLLVSGGRLKRIDPASRGVWRVDVSEDVEIVIGTRDGDDPTPVAGGFRLRWPGTEIEVDTLDNAHRAVIIGNIYSKQSDRMLKVSGEGYAYGLEAYGRRNGIDLSGVFPKEAPRLDGESLQPWQLRPNHGSGTGRGRRGRGSQSQGSGVSVADGIIVTNHHVVENGSTFRITHDGFVSNARVVGSDEFHDLAILRHDPIQGLMPVSFRDPAETYLGEELLAAGFPLAQVLGDDLKISSGNISGLKGPASDVSRLQFTAPISSGSSGGAIVDTSGRLIGIVAAALSHETMRAHGGTSENVNFAVKASLVREMLVAAGIRIESVQPSAHLGRAELAAVVRRCVVSVNCSSEQ